MVMAIHFGLQGFTSALVTLPRLVVYGTVIYAVKSIPDLGVSASGFQWLHLEGFNSFNNHLMICTLIIIALSLAVHALNLAKVLVSGIVCSCSVCFLGRIKKTIDRDLKSRIAMHVLSTYHSTRFQHKTYTNSHSQYELNLSERTDQLGIKSKSEKAIESATIDLNRKSHDVSDEVSLGPEPSKTTSMIHEDSFAPMNADLPSLNHISRNSIISGEQESPSNSFAAPLISYPQRYHDTSSSPPRPAMTEIYSNTVYSQPTWISACTPTVNRQVELMSEDAIIRSGTNNGIPGNRLATLSFYDDLLKNISSERMMYASSLSNQATGGRHQLTGDEASIWKSYPAKSSPMALSPIPPSHSNNSGYVDSINSDTPIHPFDTAAHCYPSATIQTLHYLETASKNTFVQSRGTAKENNRQLSLTNDRDNFADGFYFSSLSRRESSNSQETIENWRIRVEPSSPNISELTYDTHEQTAEDTTEYNYEFNADGILDQYDDSVSRRGTIPIILSSHILEATSSYQENQDNCFSADDLHLPRPSYACGQTRTQRQGSVNSSIGGYNYSAASSPSLADSLSNPMYQQQFFGVMNGSNCPRPFLPRKSSLPISIQSPGRDESISRAAHFQYQLSQPHISQHLACPVFPVKTRTRSPSHLSNMVIHSGIRSSYDSEEDGNVNRSSLADRERPLSTQKKTYLRSQSFGARSSGRQSVSSWNQSGYFKDAQIGYASLTNLPPSSVSHIYYQGQDIEPACSPYAKANTGSKMSPKEVSAIESPMQGSSSSFGKELQYVPVRHYAGEIDGQFVHPLDLSPLRFQPQQRSQPASHDHIYFSSTMHYDTDTNSQHAEAQAAWTETCVGLGLTFNSNLYDKNNGESISSREITEEYPLQRPTSVKHHSSNYGESVDNNSDINSYQWSNPSGQSEVTTSKTATTELSIETLTNPYQAAMTTDADNDYENDMLRYHKQHLNAAILNQRLSQTNRQELSTVQRQASQRNKKNLVVNIVPLN
ncbi:hypothetical protein BGX27_006288 [Mortierella sp. AM989]|nr:hypothetical protein BGX27_006288 [Mortierella sp. AM989]